MSKSKNNVVEMNPATDEPEAEEKKELTQEEYAKLIEQEKIDREKSRIVHLKAIATNHLGMRTAFQNAIISSIATSPSKIKSTCESYLNWAAEHYKAIKIDCSEVLEDPDLQEMAERSRETMKQNSLVGYAALQVAVQTAVIKRDGATNALIESFGYWNRAEELADSFCAKGD